MAKSSRPFCQNTLSNSVKYGLHVINNKTNKESLISLLRIYFK